MNMDNYLTKKECEEMLAYFQNYCVAPNGDTICGHTFCVKCFDMNTGEIVCEKCLDIDKPPYMKIAFPDAIGPLQLYCECCNFTAEKPILNGLHMFADGVIALCLNNKYLYLTDEAPHVFEGGE